MTLFRRTRAVTQTNEVCRVLCCGVARYDVVAAAAVGVNGGGGGVVVVVVVVAAAGGGGGGGCCFVLLFLLFSRAAPPPRARLSQDIDDLSAVARLFDAFLSAHPLLPLYLAAALALRPAARAALLETEPEFAEMHQVL